MTKLWRSGIILSLAGLATGVGNYAFQALIGRFMAKAEFGYVNSTLGFIGLLNALSKYDPASGAKFSTYAQHLVTGEIKHYLRDRSQTIRQPAWNLTEIRTQELLNVSA